MTKREREALQSFARHIGYFAQITQHHMKRSIPKGDRDAINEIDGIYDELIQARDTLLNILR